MFTQIASFLIDVVASFFVYALLARFLFQWLRVPFRNALGEFIVAVTNWMVLPARRIVPSLGGLDLASLLLALLVQAAALYVLIAIRGADFSSSPGIAAGIIAGLALIDLLQYTVFIQIFALVVQAVLSWVNPYSPVAPVFDALTRTFLRPIRRFVPPVGGVDLSPLVLIVLLQVLLIPLAHLRGMVAGLFSAGAAARPLRRPSSPAWTARARPRRRIARPRSSRATPWSRPCRRSPPG